MLNLKSIAATLAVLGSGAALTACGGSQAKATEVPAAQGQPEHASCAASGNCGASKGAGQGATPEGSCSAKKDEHSCGAKPGAGNEGSCGAKTSEATSAPSPAGTTVADTATTQPASSATPSAASSKPAGKPAGKPVAKKHKHGEASCGEGSCA
jgi:hypothetical protein